MWLDKIKLTPKGDDTKTDIMAFFVNFFMYSPKAILKWEN